MIESYSNIESNELVRGIIYEREEYTEEEIKEFREDLIRHVHELVDYFNNDSHVTTTKEKLDLLAFSILSTIDGNSGDIGGYLMIPIPKSHFYDPNFELPENLYNYDIAGELHSQYASSIK